MPRLRKVALATVMVIACRDSDTVGPVAERPAMRARAAPALASVVDERAAYLSDGGGASLLVVGEVSHDTIAVVRFGGPAEGPAQTAASPDGARVYAVLAAVEQLGVVQTSDNTVLAKIPLGGSGSAGVVVSPDNRWVYVGNRSGTISVVDATTLQRVALIPVSGISPFKVAVTPDGAHLYVGDNLGSWVAVVNTATRAVERYITVGYRPWSVDVTPNGQFVYVANRGGTVSKIATATNTVVATFTLGGMPVGLAVTPDGQRVFVANNGNDNLVVFSVATDQVLATIPLADAYYPQVTPDGRWVYVVQNTYGAGAFAVLDAQTLAVVASIPVAYPSSGISFAPYTAPSQPTTTTVASSTAPSVTGQAVSFTATVAAGGAPVAVGAVTFRLGGTTCADAPTVLAGPLPLDASGQAVASHAFLAADGPYTVRACYAGTTTAPRYDPSEGAVVQTVNPAPVAVVASADPVPQQYSDQIVLRAELGLEAGALQWQTLTGVVTFAFDGVPVGTAAVSATTLPATVTLDPPYAVAAPAGNHVVSATFASTNPNFGSGGTTPAAALVTAEDAALTPDPTFPTEARVTAPFGTSGPLTFAFLAREASPESNADPSLVRPGDLTRTAARAVFSPSGGSAPIVLSCVGGAVTGSGYAQVRPFSCATAGLAAEVYQVTLQVVATPGGSYYAGTHGRTFRVYDPSGEATDLMDDVAGLVDAGALNAGTADALSSKLRAAVASIGWGNTTAAIQQVEAFVRQVEALVRSGTLTASAGDALLAAARTILADLAK